MKKNLQTAFSSRQYMFAKDFEVYYYNDNRLSKVSDHAHNYYEFYFFIEGEVSITIGDSQHLLKAGDIIIIPPGVYHHAMIQSQEQIYRRFVLWVSEAYWSQLLEISKDFAYLMQHVQDKKTYIFHNDVITFNAIQSKVFQLIEEVHSKRFGKEVKLSICINDLLLHLNRVVYERDFPQSFKEERSLYQNLTAFIEAHLEEELSLERLAGEFFVSKYHIAHVFKDKVGLSVHQYITKKRLAACKNAILGNIRISEAYLMFGFRDYSGFYRAFKKEYGVSPKEFKNECLRMKAFPLKNGETV